MTAAFVITIGSSIIDNQFGRFTVATVEESYDYVKETVTVQVCNIRRPDIFFVEHIPSVLEIEALGSAHEYVDAMIGILFGALSAVHLIHRYQVDITVFVQIGRSALVTAPERNFQFPLPIEAIRTAPVEENWNFFT